MNGLKSNLPRIAIVATNASLRMGGEAARPIHYFRGLRARGADARLIAHERNRKELIELLPDEQDRIYYALDSTFQRRVWKLHLRINRGFSQLIAALLIYASTERQQRTILRDLVRNKKVDVVHVPIPITPKKPSFIYDVGAPVMYGPLNGDMSYPSAFRSREGWLSSLIVETLRLFSHVTHFFIPGKRKANIILVSNERTAKALPLGCTARTVQLVANAIDTSIWKPPEQPRNYNAGPISFTFLGRLVDFKGVDLVLDALAIALKDIDAHLTIIGDGPLRATLEQQTRDLNIADHVTFAGWLPSEPAAQLMAESDVFVFPSLRDPGGAVIMEAMSLGLPIIAMKWGGPADYADDQCALLIEPKERSHFVAEFAAAMVKIQDPELRSRMSTYAAQRAATEFTWQNRIDTLCELYTTLNNPDQGALAHPPTG